MKNEKLNVSIKVTLLSVIAFLLQYIELPIPLFPEFLKIDVSDLPALIGAFAFGPIHGVIIELFKNILHGIFATKTGFVGELANFLIGSSLVLISGYVYKIKKSKKSAALGLILGTLIMSLIAGVFNYYVLLPLYAKLFGANVSMFVAAGTALNSNIKDLSTFILWAIIPFNIIKGIFVSIITLTVYKSVSPILHKENSTKNQIANGNW